MMIFKFRLVIYIMYFVSYLLCIVILKKSVNIFLFYLNIDSKALLMKIFETLICKVSNSLNGLLI